MLLQALDLAGAALRGSVSRRPWHLHQTGTSCARAQLLHSGSCRPGDVNGSSPSCWLSAGILVWEAGPCLEAQLDTRQGLSLCIVQASVLLAVQHDHQLQAIAVPLQQTKAVREQLWCCEQLQVQGACQ